MVDFDMELDYTALAFAILMTLFVGGSVFGLFPTVGDWGNMPFWYRAGIALGIGPITYMVVLWQMQK